MTTSQSKKHACPDCRKCQNCAPSRCHLCRGQEAERRFAGLSMADQIALFEAINRGEVPEGRYGPGAGCQARDQAQALDEIQAAPAGD